MNIWKRIRFMFIRNQGHWDHEKGVLTVFKEHKGWKHIVAQEPIAYGDPRNHQISRWGL